MDAIHSLRTCLEISSFMGNSINQGHGKTLKKFVHLEGEVIGNIGRKFLNGKSVNNGKILKNIGKNKENVIIEIENITVTVKQNGDLKLDEQKNQKGWGYKPF